MNKNQSLKERIFYQSILIQSIRQFFYEKNFLDVLTPPVVMNPGMETHIHPFQLKSVRHKVELPLYLHTSPEFHMKELLSHGLGDIFTIGYCFRDEPDSVIHRQQFIMLEWYRRGMRYEKIMDDCDDLLLYCLESLKNKGLKTLDNKDQFKCQRVRVQELFWDVVGIDILEYLEVEELRLLIQRDFKEIPLPDQKLSWDDYFFLLFLNKVEPVLKHYPAILLYEYPHHLSALSTLSKNDQRVCERFEIYLNGIELCNCFNELTDIEIQKKRFSEQAKQKASEYGYTLPTPDILYDSLIRGFPESSGVAMGVERLLMALTAMEEPFYQSLKNP